MSWQRQIIIMSTISKKSRAKRTDPRGKLDPNEVGKALGASRRFKVQNRPRGPVGAAALAQEVQARLVSRGGRPSDSAPTLRRLVPIRKSVWDDLQRRADLLSASGRKVSAGQLAAILLERGLQGLNRSEEPEARAG